MINLSMLSLIGTKRTYVKFIDYETPTWAIIHKVLFVNHSKYGEFTDHNHNI
jgi:hypothetical protein